MEAYQSELENLLSMQEYYFEKLVDLGLCLENSGHPDKAFDIYKKALASAEKSKLTISGTMLGLID
jgi:hypothetical protein